MFSSGDPKRCLYVIQFILCFTNKCFCKRYSCLGYFLLDFLCHDFVLFDHCVISALNFRKLCAFKSQLKGGAIYRNFLNMDTQLVSQ